MAVSKGVNSYVTVAEADAYFANRVDADAWLAANDAKKGQAVVTATSMLDEMTWAGTVISDAQQLAFPRVCEYFDPKAGTILYLTGDIVPDRVIRATYELALHLLLNNGILNDVGGVESISIGSIGLSNLQTAARVPYTVRQIIKPLLINSGSNAWWRAN